MTHELSTHVTFEKIFFPLPLNIFDALSFIFLVAWLNFDVHCLRLRLDSRWVGVPHLTLPHRNSDVFYGRLCSEVQNIPCLCSGYSITSSLFLSRASPLPLFFNLCPVCPTLCRLMLCGLPASGLSLLDCDPSASKNRTSPGRNCSV